MMVNDDVTDDDDDDDVISLSDDDDDDNVAAVTAQYVTYYVRSAASLRLYVRVSTTPGNAGNLLEFNGPPGNFCVR